MKFLASEKQALTKHSNVLPKTWSKYNAGKERVKPGINGINIILPLILKPAHTLDTQYHCMQITKNTILFFNPNQTPMMYLRCMRSTSLCPHKRNSNSKI